jgi:DNA-binding transcriptional LysR family regulator
MSAMDLVDRVAHRLKLRDLRLLDAVVRWRSMAKAASQLNLSQPAVSKAIAEMEHTLGVRLVDRGRQGVEPTPYGRALLKRGVAIFDELRQGVSEIEYLSDPTAGEVRIAASEPMSAGVLPVILARLSQQYPRISIYVTQLPIGTMDFRTPPYRDLHERRVDLVLGPISEPFDKTELQADALYGELLTVAVGVGNRWLRRRAVSLKDLMDDSWVLAPPDTPVGVRCANAFRLSGLEVPRRAVATISVQVMIGLLATRRFIAMLPGSVIHFSGKRFSTEGLPIKLPVPGLPIAIITLRNRTISPAAKIFIQMAREITKSLPKARQTEVKINAWE